MTRLILAGLLLAFAALCIQGAVYQRQHPEPVVHVCGSDGYCDQ